MIFQAFPCVAWKVAKLLCRAGLDLGNPPVSTDGFMVLNPCDMVDFNTVVYSFESLWYSLYGEEMNDIVFIYMKSWT